MKRFWLVLLSLGLIVAFSTSAMAVDLKFSGEYYAAGMYLDRVGVNDTAYDYYAVVANTAAPGMPPWTPYILEQRSRGYSADTSTAFYFQRLRLNTTFIVHPGLFLTTRADIMERAWGASRFAPASGVGSLDVLSSGTRAENENIAFDLAYLTYISPIGIFMAGYQIDGAWGTVFGDNSVPTARIGYVLPIKGFQLAIMAGKNADGERDYGTWNGALTDGSVDRDSDFYTAFIKYAWKGGEAGFLAKYIRNATSRNAYAAFAALQDYGPLYTTLSGQPDPRLLVDTGVKVQQLALLPYAKVQLGPVALQAEISYVTGRISYDGHGEAIPIWQWGGAAAPGPQQNQRLDMLSGWIDGTADFGIAYVGGSFAYMSGDKPETRDKVEGGATGGLDWNPCLIMFNAERNYWVGGIAGYDGTSNGAPMSNAFFAQLRGGVRPVDKLNIMASVSWAKADKAPAGTWEGREYGWEIDLTGTYKITNNLSYMLGAGYWFTGDYYKGVGGFGATLSGLQNNVEVKDDFMVINKLTLTF